MAEAKQVIIKGRSLRCQHCEHQRFIQESATLDRWAFGGLFHLEGSWGHQATIYVCGQCGFAHFFLPVPEPPDMVMESPVQVVETSEPLDEEPVEEIVPSGPASEEACLSCGELIPAEADQCPACGWTWAREEAESS